MWSSAGEQDAGLVALLEAHDCTRMCGRLSSRTAKIPTGPTSSNVGSMLAAPKGTPTHNHFVTLLSDALFTLLSGKYHKGPGTVYLLRIQVFLFDQQSSSGE